jgi:hypothetical protein
MKILHNIRQKGRAAILMIALFGLVAFSFFTYNKNINQMGDLSSEMYSDRLVAQDYIYKFSKILNERKIKLALENIAPDEIFKHDKAAIFMLLTDYERTKLTKNEEIQFKKFKKNIMSMMGFELQHLLSRDNAEKINLLSLQNKSLDISLLQLDKLAEIQTLTGKQLNDASDRIVTFSALLNQFDWAVIIIIGLIIQVIIFTSRSVVPKDGQNQFLN